MKVNKALSSDLGVIMSSLRHSCAHASMTASFLAGASIYSVSSNVELMERDIESLISTLAEIGEKQAKLIELINQHKANDGESADTK